jgi:GNAT superfamily N-acetyltransferase
MTERKVELKSVETSDQYVYLADRPELIPELARWFYDEWRQNYPDLSVETIEGKLNTRLHKDKIPLVLILLRDGSPIASASLKIQEMETHPQYLHWLGSVYVLPELRGGGIGSNLIQYSAAEARRLGVRDLYLYTRSREGFYARLGWTPVERPLYHGRTVVIMLRNLLEKNFKGC